jgi:hypothetical protein
MGSALYEPIHRQGTKNPRGGAGCMDGELLTEPLDLNQDVYDRIKNKQKRVMENNVKRNILITFIGLLYVSYMIYSRM